MIRVTPATVIRALYDLDFDRRGVMVTAKQVATYLRISEEVACSRLRQLQDERIIRRRKRRGQVVYEPWRGQQ